MLIPRFTIRTLLVVTTVCALLASTISWAMGGSAWAAAVASGGVLLVIVFLIYGIFFAVAFGLARRLGKTSGLTPQPSLDLETDYADEHET